MTSVSSSSILNSCISGSTSSTTSVTAPSASDEIIAQPYDITVTDGEKGVDGDIINLWCLDRSSNPLLVRIPKFSASCYLELPQYIDNEKVKWTEEGATRMYDQLSRMLGDDAPYKYEFKEMTKYYYYRPGKTYQMLLLHFNRVQAMQHCRNLVTKVRTYPNVSSKPLTIKMDVWEDGISYVRKMFSQRNLPYTGWFRTTGVEVKSDDGDRYSDSGTQSHPRKEYTVNWTDLIPIPHEETKTWHTHPGILSIDIETYNPNHKQVPMALNPRNPVYMISCIYQRLGNRESRVRYGIIVGDCDDINTKDAKDEEKERLINKVTAAAPSNPKEVTSLKKFAEVIRVASEYELIVALAKIIKLLDPQIVTGYNVLSYDYDYLNTKLESRHLKWPEMTCVLNKDPTFNKKFWHSEGYGFNRILELRLDGRVTAADLYVIIKRAYKFPQYTLDYVSKFFLKRGKHPIKPDEQFTIYEKMRDAIADGEKAGIYTRQLTQDYYRTCCNNTSTEEKKVYSAEEKKVIQKRIDEAKTTMSRVMRYCLEDSELVIDLFEKLDVWYELIELSGIVGVTTSELFTRGQQIRCISQVYDIASHQGIVITKRSYPIQYYVGGMVGKPKPGLHDNAICMDFSSMYPSTIIAFNISPDTLIPPESMDEYTDEECNTIEFDQEEPESFKAKDYEGEEDEGPRDIDDEEIPEPDTDEKRKGKKKDEKMVVRHYKFKYIKAHIKKGILPQLVEKLLKDRAAVKGQMKEVAKKTDNLTHATDISTIRKIIKDINNKSGIGANITKRLSCLTESKTHGEIEKILKDIQKDTVVTPTEVFSEGKAKEVLPMLEEKINILIQDRDTHLEEIRQFNVEYAVLNKRQEALKVSANSIYGFLGAQRGILPCIEAAMSVTARGRQLITTVNNELKEKFNAEIIYNDTDSAMFTLGITDSKDCEMWGHRFEDFINGTPERVVETMGPNGPIKTVIPAKKGLFPPPLKMEFEKAMRILLFTSIVKGKEDPKKRYAFLTIDKNGNFKLTLDGSLDITTRGIILARRDNCQWAQELYKELLIKIMMREPITTIFDKIVDGCINLLEGKVSLDKLTIIRQLGASYKAKNYFMNVFANRIRSQGRQALPGDRLEYVIVKTMDEVKNCKAKVSTGYKMREKEAYMENNEGENIDMEYYIDHIAKSAIDQLFLSAYLNDLKLYKDSNGVEIGYRPTFNRRLRFVPVRLIIKMLMVILKDYKDPKSGAKSIKDVIPTLQFLKKWFAMRTEEVKKINQPVLSIPCITTSSNIVVRRRTIQLP